MTRKRIKIKFDIDKFVKYLDRYKSELPTLYNWSAKIDRLVELETLRENQVKEINALTPNERELKLKKLVGQKLNETLKSNTDLFNKLCLWVIKDWGHIRTASDIDTINLVNDFLNQDKPNFYRIASSSKVGSYLYPDKNVIYDSRVAYSLNWIILSENAGHHYFPIPESRNSKMSAFDLNVLIRLKNISVYRTADIKQLDQRCFIKDSDKRIFINKKDAYSELNNLVKQINRKLWQGDIEKEQNLYFTEMLLFSIADREVFMEITTKNLNELMRA
jgi:hypothetical protein